MSTKLLFLLLLHFLLITLHLYPAIPAVDSGNHTNVVDEKEVFARKYKNKPLPAFSLKALDGTTVDSKMLEGKVVMINIGSTTCHPCVVQIPDLNRLKKLHPDVLFIGMVPETAAEVNDFLATVSFDFIILTDAKELFKSFGTTTYPINFFIDRKGIIREVKQGTPVDVDFEKDEMKPRVAELYSPILKKLERKKR